MTSCSTPSVGTVIFDFDLTIAPHESLVEVLKIAWSESRGLEELSPLFQPKQESEAWILYLRRILPLAVRALYAIRTRHIDAYLRELIPQLDPRITALIQELHKKGIKVCLLSNAYEAWLKPIARQLGIPASRVWGNRFWWIRSRIIAPRPSTQLIGHKGKSKLIHNLRKHGYLSPPILVIGDGEADHQVFLDGQAEAFIQVAYFRNSMLPNSSHIQNWEQANEIAELAEMVWKQVDRSFTFR